MAFENLTGESAVNKESRRYLLMVLDSAETGSKLLRANAAGDLKVTLDGESVAVTVATLPLPTGAATEATLASLEGKDFATQTTLAALLTELQAKADLAETQPVSAASLPLPTGAATAALQLPDGHKVKVTDGTDDLGVYKEDDSLGATPSGLVLMGENAGGNAKPLQLGALNALSTYLSAALPTGTARIGEIKVRGSSDTTIDDRTKSGELGLVVAPVTQPFENVVVDDCTSTTSTAVIAAPGVGKHLEIHYLKVINRAWTTGSMIAFQWSGSTGTDRWAGASSDPGSDADAFGNNPLKAPTNEGVNFKSIAAAPGGQQAFAVIGYNIVDD